MKTATVMLVLAIFSVQEVAAAAIVGGTCESGSLAEYLALGDTGCTRDDSSHRFFGFTFSIEGLNGSMISSDPNLITVQYDPQQYGTLFYFYVPGELPGGSSLIVSFGFNVEGLTIGLQTGYGWANTPSSFDHSVEVCLDGYLHAGICGGTMASDPLGFGVDFLNTPVMQAGFVGHARLAATGGTLSRFQSDGLNRFALPAPEPIPESIPEPSSRILSALGLLGMCGLWLRQR